MLGNPLISQTDCMNHAWGTAQHACTRCRDACPADAIEMHGHLPGIDGKRCTSCTACVAACPTGAITHEQLHIDTLVARARTHVLHGRQTLRAACSAVSDPSAELSVPCHAAWTPLLLACLAGEGVHVLELDGLNQCDACPARHGSRVMAGTERDYATLNKALGGRLVLSRDVTRRVAEQRDKREPEPERRAFFRKLIPSLAQGAAMTMAQISDVMREQDQTGDEETPTPGLPEVLQRFARLLPRLQPNFTPVPRLASIPLGAIQADERCTACSQCAEHCPTNALELRAFGSNHILEFRPDACIGCDHCADICPEHAITPLPSLSLPAIAARRSRPLVMVSADKGSKQSAVS